jgi:hypothetical protein
MTAIARSTIRDTVRFRGDYTNARKFTTADLNKEIQSAFDKFWRIVADTHQGWWDKSDTVSTVAHQAYIAGPTDAWRIQAVDILIGTEYVPLLQVGLEARNRYGSTESQPLGYRLSARGIELYPTPNQVYTLRANYTPLPTTLDESTTREWYTGWEDYVIEQTLFQLDKRERKPLNDRLVTLKAVEDALRSGANERRSQEPEYLVLREYDDFDPYNDGLL